MMDHFNVDIENMKNIYCNCDLVNLIKGATKL